MEFDLDYPINGTLYCITVEAYDHQDYVIHCIERYINQDKPQTRSLTNKEFEELVATLDNDNDFSDLVYVACYIYG